MRVNVILSKVEDRNEELAVTGKQIEATEGVNSVTISLVWDHTGAKYRLQKSRGGRVSDSIDSRIVSYTHIIDPQPGPPLEGSESETKNY